MLLKIREKAQGVFAWVILILICVPFALWGIQNYLDVGKETPVATVGDKEFFQRDVNRAYAQYSQNLTGMNIDEDTLKKQALEKLIRDEVLLQYVQDQGLAVTDESTRNFIGSLEYFQTDGKFDKKQYKALLGSQQMSSGEFEARIRKALIMEQFQRSIMESSFASQYDVDSFFKIQNQQRNVEFVTVPVTESDELSSDEQIEAYYQQNRDAYKTAEQVSIEYIDLSLEELAGKLEPTEEQLREFYNSQKDAFTTKERRKISHILFANSESALDKAKQAKERLKKEDFAKLAQELSEDPLSAKNGGDLGLIEQGVMEKAFEEAAIALQEGEVSEPVKTAFGYHLIKVTELSEGSVKTFEEVKDVVKLAYQKAEVENTFYELGETLTEVSYENPDNLDAASQSLGIETKKTGLFTRGSGEGIAAEQSIRDAAFSEDVLVGNNSEPIELGTDRIVVLRILEHEPAATRELQEVKQSVQEALIKEAAKKQAAERAEQIKQELESGKSFKAIADAGKLELKTFPALSRNNGDVPWEISRSIFKAAKPKADKSTVLTVVLESGEQVVINLLGVTEGKPLSGNEKEQELVRTNIARAYGQADFNSILTALQDEADIKINEPR